MRAPCWPSRAPQELRFRDCENPSLLSGSSAKSGESGLATDFRGPSALVGKSRRAGPSTVRLAAARRGLLLVAGAVYPLPPPPPRDALGLEGRVLALEGKEEVSLRERGG